MAKPQANKNQKINLDQREKNEKEIIKKMNKNYLKNIVVGLFNFLQEQKEEVQEYYQKNISDDDKQLYHIRQFFYKYKPRRLKITNKYQFKRLFIDLEEKNNQKNGQKNQINEDNEQKILDKNYNFNNQYNFKQQQFLQNSFNQADIQQESLININQEKEQKQKQQIINSNQQQQTLPRRNYGDIQKNRYTQKQAISEQPKRRCTYRQFQVITEQKNPSKEDKKTQLSDYLKRYPQEVISTYKDWTLNKLFNNIDYSEELQNLEIQVIELQKLEEKITNNFNKIEGFQDQGEKENFQFENFTKKKEFQQKIKNQQEQLKNLQRQIEQQTFEIKQQNLQKQQVFNFYNNVGSTNNINVQQDKINQTQQLNEKQQYIISKKLKEDSLYNKLNNNIKNKNYTSLQQNNLINNKQVDNFSKTFLQVQQTNSNSSNCQQQNQNQYLKELEEEYDNYKLNQQYQNSEEKTESLESQKKQSSQNIQEQQEQLENFIQETINGIEEEFYAKGDQQTANVQQDFKNQIINNKNVEEICKQIDENNNSEKDDKRQKQLEKNQRVKNIERKILRVFLYKFIKGEYLSYCMNRSRIKNAQYMIRVRNRILNYLFNNQNKNGNIRGIEIENN